MELEKENLRAFFAIALPSDIKHALEKIIQELKTLASPQDRLQWVKLDQLHITLQFMEKIAAKDVPLLIETVSLALQNFSMFDVTLTELQLFPSKYLPRVISLNMSPQETLTELAQKIGQEIKNCGYPIESRHFRGHLTLARIKQLTSKLALEKIQAHLPVIKVDNVVLFRSDASREGMIYTAMHHIPLK